VPTAALALLRACHPEPAGLVTLLTCVLALAAGLGWRTALLGAAVGAGQLAVGWSNDYLDRGLDRAANRQDKPLASPATTDLTPATVRAAALLALGAAAILSIVVSIGFAAAHLAAVAAALVYNAGLKARPLSVVPYALAFGLLPVAVALALSPPRLPPAWAVVAAALVGTGGHFTQALPDIPADRRLGLRGLPQLAGERASAILAAALLFAANLVIALASGTLTVPHVALAVALTAGIVAAALTGHPRAAFRLTLGEAALAVAAFVATGSRL